MNELLSVGLILLAALAAGHLAQRVRLPEVTGYLAMGALIGPTALDVITHDNLEALQLLSEVALGLILFSIGTIFEADTFRPLGLRVAVITAAEAFGAFLLVITAMLLLGVPAAACARMERVWLHRAWRPGRPRARRVGPSRHVDERNDDALDWHRARHRRGCPCAGAVAALCVACGRRDNRQRCRGNRAARRAAPARRSTALCRVLRAGGRGATYRHAS